MPHAKVDLADTGDAGRGLVARQRIKENEALLRVPEGRQFLLSIMHEGGFQLEASLPSQVKLNALTGFKIHLQCAVSYCALSCQT